MYIITRLIFFFFNEPIKSYIFYIIIDFREGRKRDNKARAHY